MFRYKNCGLLTGVLLVNLEELVDLVANLTVGHLDVVLGVTIIVHEGEEAIVGDVELLRILVSFAFGNGRGQSSLLEGERGVVVPPPLLGASGARVHAPAGTRGG